MHRDRGPMNAGLRRVMTALCFGIPTRAKNHGGRSIKACAEGILIPSDATHLESERHAETREAEAWDSSSRGRWCMKTNTGLTLISVFQRCNRGSDLQGFTVNAVCVCVCDPDVNYKSFKRISEVKLTKKWPGHIYTPNQKKCCIFLRP